MSKTKKEIGKLGEDLACKFLLKKDFEILDRNYHTRDGEIDIVAIKGKKYHFVEVKSRSKINHKEEVFPEMAVDDIKKIKIEKSVEKFFFNNRIQSMEVDWQIDIISIIINWPKRIAKVKLFPRI